MNRPPSRTWIWLLVLVAALAVGGCLTSLGIRAWFEEPEPKAECVGDCC